MKEEKNSTEAEYKLETNENGQKVIKKFSQENTEEINIIFEENETDVMTDVLKQLSKYYIEEVWKRKCENNNKLENLHISKSEK